MSKFESGDRKIMSQYLARETSMRDPVGVHGAPGGSEARKGIGRLSLPTERQARKDIPLYWGLVNYFRDALIGVAKLSQIGNEQHNPGEPLHWAREKGGDELDAQMRHIFELHGIDIDLVPHSVKNAWRALAVCQLDLEANPWTTSVADTLKLMREQDIAKRKAKVKNCLHCDEAICDTCAPTRLVPPGSYC